MKRLVGLSVVTAMLAGLMAMPVFAEGEMHEMMAEHQRLATRYEQYATEQDALIQEHEAMISGASMKFMNPKATVGERKRAMKRHCERIIANAKMQRDEFRDMAKLHRESAEMAH